MVDKMLYNTILAQTFSPCGNYLLAGNTYGAISVYDLQEVLSPGNDKTPKFRPPSLQFYPCKDETQISSLATTEDFLIVGTVGEILGFHWETIVTMKNPALSWKITLPSNKDELDKADVNSMTIRPEEDRVYAGCGDSKVYCYDLDGGKLIRTFQGHEDYIHCVHSTSSQIVSASEDGSARIWDPRQQKENKIVKPYLESKLSRPALGRWLGAAAISDDWMVCGGGPYLSLWHLRSMALTEAYTSLTDNGIHATMMYEDRVLAAGASPYLTHLSLTGSLLAQVPSSSTCLYSIALQEKPIKVLCMAGSSSRIDICTNPNYRDQILTFLK